MKTIIALCLLLLGFNSFGQQSKNKISVEKNRVLALEDSLYKKATTNERLPSSLLKTYAQFVKAIQTKDRKAIAEKAKFYLLDNSITINETPREKNKDEYGTDINIDFLITKFNPYIITIKKYSNSSYMIRTGTTLINYVETKTEGWKIYFYADKPID